MKGISPTLHQTDLTILMTLGALLTVLWTANIAGAMPSLPRLFAAQTSAIIKSQGVAQVDSAPFNAKGTQP